MKRALKFFLGLGLIASNASTAFAALEVIDITFNKSIWDSNMSDRKFPYTSFSGRQQWDLKKLINDIDSPQKDPRSYILMYEKDDGVNRLNYEGKLDLNGAIVAGVEVRARGNADMKFSVNIDGIESPLKGSPNPNSIFSNVIFNSIQMQIPKSTPSQGNWILTMHGGNADINQIIVHVYTNGKSCLRNLCNKYLDLISKPVNNPGYLNPANVNGFGYKTLKLTDTKYSMQFVNIPAAAKKIEVYVAQGTVGDNIIPIYEFTSFPDRKNFIIKDQQWNLSFNRGQKFTAEAVDAAGNTIASFSHVVQ